MMTPQPQTGSYDQSLMLRTRPVWTERRDDGGMFRCVLAVYRDDDPDSTRPFLAAAKDGWGRGSCARRATLDEAIAHTHIMHRKYLA